MDIDSIKAKLRSLLKEKRYQHSLSTADLAKDLARHWGLDQQQAYLAGLLHDHARCYSDRQLQAFALQLDLDIDRWTFGHPSMLHGPVAAALLPDWGVDDAAVAEAIHFHTIPSAQMADLAKIIFIADKIEPNRQPWPAQERIKELAYRNLDEAVLLTLVESWQYLMEIGEPIDPKTQDIIQQYRNKIDKASDNNYMKN
jgi:predicted HD superfamily hydrolase involved in NAD metabolism